MGNIMTNKNDDIWDEEKAFSIDNTPSKYQKVKNYIKSMTNSRQEKDIYYGALESNKKELGHINPITNWDTLNEITIH